MIDSPFPAAAWTGDRFDFDGRARTLSLRTPAHCPPGF